MPSQPVFPTIHSCRCGDRLILLDLARGRYVALEGDEAEAFEPFLRHTPATLPEASRALAIPAERMYSRIRVHHVWAFLRSVMFAKLALRLLPIRCVVGYVSWRKRRRAMRPVPWRAEPLDEIVGIFFRLRPLALRGRDACLLRSLALVEFLARYRVFPEWVFAVQSVPFAAHSWVQYRGVVLNDHMRRVREFTPILVV